MEVEVGFHASAKDLFTKGKNLPFGAEPGHMSMNGGNPKTTEFKNALGSTTGATISGFGFNTHCTDTTAGIQRQMWARWVRQLPTLFMRALDRTLTVCCCLLCAAGLVH